MRLLVGLGNLGARYADTRHNLGFRVLDRLASDQHWPPFAVSKFEAVLSRPADKNLIAAKPTTMMNLSGQAIHSLAHFYKLSAPDIWVVHDDIDLAFGLLRFRWGGSSGGHNGVESIIGAIGPEFGRWRIGVKNAELHAPLEAADFVLQPFNPDEAKKVPQIVADAAKIIADSLGTEPNNHSINLLALNS